MGFGLFLLVALGTGCAHDRAKAQPPPAWASPEGRRAAQLDMARFMLDAGRPEEALQVLTAARQTAGGEDLEMDLLQARALQARGLHLEALGLVEPWTHRRLRNAELEGVVGLLEFDLGRLPSAEAHLRLAAELAPEQAEAWNNLGFVLMVQGREEEAVEAFQAALKQAPNNDRARNNLGFALATLGRDREALAAFKASSTEGSALANMGLAKERSGDLPAALDFYQRALSVEPGQSIARQGVQRLATHPPSTEVTP